MGSTAEANISHRENFITNLCSIHLLFNNTPITFLSYVYRYIPMDVLLPGKQFHQYDHLSLSPQS